MISSSDNPKFPFLIFSFSFVPSTQEAVFAGNMTPQMAFQILQQIVISEAIKEATQPQNEADKAVKSEIPESKTE